MKEDTGGSFLLKIDGKDGPLCPATRRNSGELDVDMPGEGKTRFLLYGHNRFQRMKLVQGERYRVREPQQLGTLFAATDTSDASEYMGDI